MSVEGGGRGGGSQLADVLAVATREERNTAGCVGAAAGVVRQGERGYRVGGDLFSSFEGRGEGNWRRG